MTGSVVTRGFLLALLFSGCRQVLGVDDFGTKSVTYIGGTDGYTYVSRVCRDCVDEHCEEEAANCAADPGCKAQARCVALCAATDHECRGRCSLSTPSSVPMADLVACEATHCGGSLSDEDRCAGSLALHGNAACNRCLATRCRQALEELSLNAPALLFERRRDVCTCHGDCPDGAPGCDWTADDETIRLADAVRDCCDCAESVPDWSCVGHVESPAPPDRAPPLELHLRATKPDFVTPFPNLLVRACSNLTGQCELSEATTGADGWAHLTIPPRKLDSYFDHLKVWPQNTEEAPPALFYFFPAIRETPTWIVRRMVTRADAEFVLQQIPELKTDWDNRGGIVFSARSCNATPQGLRLSVKNKPELRVIYFAKVPVVDLNAEEASSEGLGFIANVDPGFHHLEANRPTGQLVGTYTVQVLAGSLTHLVVEPTELMTGTE